MEFQIECNDKGESHAVTIVRRVQVWPLSALVKKGLDPVLSELTPTGSHYGSNVTWCFLLCRG